MPKAMTSAKNHHNHQRISPRKFSEKIALLNQKEAEGTAAFEQIINEVNTTCYLALPKKGLSNSHQELSSIQHQQEQHQQFSGQRQLVHHQQPQLIVLQQQQQHDYMRPKSCEVPNINVSRVEDDLDSNGFCANSVPISSSTKSLPDLSDIRFQTTRIDFVHSGNPLHSNQQQHQSRYLQHQQNLQNQQQQQLSPSSPLDQIPSMNNGGGLVVSGNCPASASYVESVYHNDNIKYTNNNQYHSTSMSPQAELMITNDDTQSLPYDCNFSVDNSPSSISSNNNNNNSNYQQQQTNSPNECHYVNDDHNRTTNSTNDRDVESSLNGRTPFKYQADQQFKYHPAVRSNVHSTDNNPYTNVHTTAAPQRNSTPTQNSHFVTASKAPAVSSIGDVSPTIINSQGRDLARNQQYDSKTNFLTNSLQHAQHQHQSNQNHQILNINNSSNNNNHLPLARSGSANIATTWSTSWGSSADMNNGQNGQNATGSVQNTGFSLANRNLYSTGNGDGCSNQLSTQAASGPIPITRSNSHNSISHNHHQSSSSSSYFNHQQQHSFSHQCSPTHYSTNLMLPANLILDNRPINIEASTNQVRTSTTGSSLHDSSSPYSMSPTSGNQPQSPLNGSDEQQWFHQPVSRQSSHQNNHHNNSVMQPMMDTSQDTTMAGMNIEPISPVDHGGGNCTGSDDSNVNITPISSTALHQDPIESSEIPDIILTEEDLQNSDRIMNQDIQLNDSQLEHNIALFEQFDLHSSYNDITDDPKIHKKFIS